MQALYEIIRRPVLSEKSRALTDVANRYVFEVDVKANKPKIKEAIQTLFNVKVLDVRTMIVHGKVKRKGRFEVRHANWKKAIVTLPVGQKIDFFEKRAS